VDSGKVAVLSFGIQPQVLAERPVRSLGDGLDELDGQKELERIDRRLYCEDRVEHVLSNEIEEGLAGSLHPGEAFPDGPNLLVVHTVLIP